ncbi:MAG: type II secretion system F family protein [Acetobacterium sp.]
MASLMDIMEKTFAYKAKNSLGEVIRGNLQATTKREAAIYLQNQNLLAMEITEEKKGMIYLNKNLDFRLRAVKTKDFSRFCRQFHIILSAGVPIARCLELLRDQTRDRGFSQDISGVCHSIRSGAGLSQAMGAYPKSFPALFVFMVEAGEISGNLPEILLGMAEHYETEDKNHRQIRQALFYPIMLVLVAVLVVVFLLTNVLPTFVGMFEAMDAPLPEPTRILLGVSQTLIQDWPIILLLIAGVIFLTGLVLKIEPVAVFIDVIKIRLPGLGSFNGKRSLVLLSKTLSLLLRSGIDLLSALNRLEGVTENRLVKKEVKELSQKISGGSRLAQAMEESVIFPSLFCQLVSIGEASGSLTAVLDKITLIYENEVEDSIKLMNTLIEPLILIILGGAVLFILAAIMLPVFDIYTAYSAM